MKIYTCGCLADEFFMKTGNDILKIFENREIFENRVDLLDFIRINVDDNFYIFCPWITEFCYKTNRWYFYGKTCDTLGLYEECYLLSCFHLLKYGFKSICQLCISPLQVKLFPFLIKVK